MAATPGARSHSAAPHVTASWGRVRKAGPPTRLAGWVPRAPPPPGPERAGWGWRAPGGRLRSALGAWDPHSRAPRGRGGLLGGRRSLQSLSFLPACTRDAQATANRSWGPQRRRGSGADGPGASKGRRRVRFPRSSAGRLGDGAGEAGGSCVRERSGRAAAGFPHPLIPWRYTQSRTHPRGCTPARQQCVQPRPFGLHLGPCHQGAPELAPRGHGRQRPSLVAPGNRPTSPNTFLQARIAQILRMLKMINSREP